MLNEALKEVDRSTASLVNFPDESIDGSDNSNKPQWIFALKTGAMMECGKYIV
jgi:hypothetical protein